MLKKGFAWILVRGDSVDTSREIFDVETGTYMHMHIDSVAKIY